MYGIRGEGKSATHRAMEFMKQKRFDASLVHTHTFNLDELPKALKYARERIDNAIKEFISQGYRTKDISTTEEYVKTSEVASILIGILKNG